MNSHSMKFWCYLLAVTLDVSLASLGCTDRSPAGADGGGTGIFLPTTLTSASGAGDSTSGSASGTGDGGALASTSAAASSSSGEPATGGTSDPPPSLKFDLGSLPDPGSSTGQSAEGCTKIDFLFVVDNSGSMAEEQAALIDSFPSFIQSIQGTVKAQDYQILTVDTDDGYGLGYCDGHLGAGIVNTPEGSACGVDGGHRYMLPNQPALADTFACVATVGTNGDSLERPMEAMVEAITTQNGPGKCNEGFLRPDAILVVTFITDEEDIGKSTGDPTSWRSSLVMAKGGNDQALVVLGLMGGDESCPDAEFAPNLKAFTDSFSFGSWGPICAPSYTPFFDQAVMVIDSACDTFVPPG